MSIDAKIDKLIEAMNGLSARLDKMAGTTGGRAAPAPAAEKDEAPQTKAADKKGPGRPPKIKAEDVAAKANEVLEAKGKPAARALLKEHGSPDGKIATLPAEGYAAFMKAADALLSEDEGDEGEDEGDDSI